MKKYLLCCLIFIALIFSSGCKEKSVTITKQEMVIDQTVYLPLDVKGIALEELSFIADNENVVTIEEGMIVPNQAGKVTVTIYGENDKEWGSFNVIVLPQISNMTIIAGDDEKITALNCLLDEYQFNYDSDVIAITDDIVHGNNPGTVTVQAVSKDNPDVKTSFTVNVLPKDISITVLGTTDNILLVSNGQKLDLQLEGCLRTDVVISFSEQIVELNDDVFVVKGNGTTTMILRSGSYSISYEVIVLPTITVPSTLQIGSEGQIITDDNDITFIAEDEYVKIEGLKIIALKEGKTEVIAYKGDVLLEKFPLTVLPDAPIISCELSELRLNEGMFFFIENYNDPTLFNITIDNPILEVDDDLFLFAIGTGIVNVTFTHKYYPELFATVMVEVLNPKLSLSLQQRNIKINTTFTIATTNYDDPSLFDIIFDRSIVSYQNGIFTAIGEGKTTITYTLKTDDRITNQIDVEVYPLIPVIAVNKTELTVGEQVRLDCLNYNYNEYDITLSVNGIITLDANVIYATSVGGCEVKVALKSDPTLFSTIDIIVYPVMPLLRASSSIIKQNEQIELFITNFPELDYKSYDDYDLKSNDERIATISSGWILNALENGEVDVTVTAKQNNQITTTITILITTSPTVVHSNGEVGEGPLMLSLQKSSGSIHAGEMTNLNIDKAVDYEKYIYTSSNTKVLTVGEKGRIIAISEGYAVITVALKDDTSIKGQYLAYVYGEPNVDYIGRLITIAEAEIGYRESGDNITKFGAWYGLDGEPWCAMFVSWCANQAGISTDIIPRYASVQLGMEWFVNKNQFKYKEEYDPKAGDIIIFKSDGASHTGIVIAYENGIVYTIEGNTSQMVAKRNYDKNHSTITGYGVPVYPAYDGESQGGSTGGSTSGDGESTT